MFKKISHQMHLAITSALHAKYGSFSAIMIEPQDGLLWKGSKIILSNVDASGKSAVFHNKDTFLLLLVK